ncbi:MAG: TetR/AcrR family transcriptional regulator [Thiotrichales bacterium]
MTPSLETAAAATPTRVRQRILETALHLFTVRGYFNTSVHDVQREAGVSIGSIYNHFGGKEGIAAALYDELLEANEALVDRLFAEHTSTHDRFRALITALFEATERDPERVGWVFHAKHTEFLPGRPPICSSTPFIKIREMVKEGLQNGELRPMDPWVAANSLLGSTLHMIHLRLDHLITTPLPSYLDEVWQAAWRSVVNTGRD